MDMKQCLWLTNPAFVYEDLLSSETQPMPNTYFLELIQWAIAFNCYNSQLQRGL